MALDTELAWAAGFIDGEGCIHIARARTRQYVNYQLVLRVTQRTPEPIHELERIFGGFVSSFQATSYSKNQQCLWGCSNKAAGLVLEAVLPFLIVKKTQAELAITFQAMRSAPRERTDRATGRFITMNKAPYDRLYHEMRALKKVA